MSTNNRAAETSNSCRSVTARWEVVREVSLRIRPGRNRQCHLANGAGKTHLAQRPLRLLPAAGEVAYRQANATTAWPSGWAGPQPGAGKPRAVQSDECRGQPAAGRLQPPSPGPCDHGVTLSEVFELFPRLRNVAASGTLSGGERQMRPRADGQARLPMLDEPSLALRAIGEIFRIITDLRATSVSILLVEQNARAALKRSDYGYVLKTGRGGAAGPRSGRRSEGHRDLFRGCNGAEPAATALAG